MAGRIYVVPFDAITVTNDPDQDIWELLAGSLNPIKLHGFSLTSTLLTDERVRLRLVRRSATGTSGVASTEVTLSDDDNTMAALTVVQQLVLSPGAVSDVLMGWQWSQQGEFLFLPTPELRPHATSAQRLALHLQTAVAASRTWSGWVAWEE